MKECIFLPLHLSIMHSIGLVLVRKMWKSNFCLALCVSHTTMPLKEKQQNKTKATTTKKTQPINCPHTVTKCHQELAHSLTWHLIICLQSESWQAPPSEPSARLVFCCVVSAHSNHNQGTIRGDKGFLQQKVPSARATTMFLLLMPSLPIKSATVNYCNYESELSVCPPSPLLWSPSLHGVWRSYGSWCAASLGPRLCSVEALAGNWMRSGGQTRCTWQGWCEGDCTVHAG